MERRSGCLHQVGEPVSSTGEVGIRPFSADDRHGVIDLWQRCGLTRAWNDPGLDIDRNLAAGLALLVADTGIGTVIGTVMVGYDGHRGWVNYLAVDPGRRGTGLGRRLMTAAEDRLRAAGCPKLNLQIRIDDSGGGTTEGAVDFYRALGYEVDPVLSMGRRLIDDEAEMPSASDTAAAEAELIGLERAMWATENRNDRAWLDRHLTSSFLEHGRSGRVYDRAAILASTETPVDLSSAVISGVTVRLMGPRHAAVTYRSELDGRAANRLSVWRNDGDGWRLDLHQGTPIAD